MPELSKLVRQRLASGDSPGVHPDADTLTAYAEQLLPASEREQVLEHIAACSHCREVVALSLPEPVAGAGAAAAGFAASGRRWRWTPAFGLAASLAAMAIVTTVIIELPQRPMPLESKKASQTAPVNSAAGNGPAAIPTPAPLESATANVQPPASSTLAMTRAGSSAGRLTREAAASPAPAVQTARMTPPAGNTGSVTRALGRDYVNKQMFAADQSTADAAATGANEMPAAAAPRPSANQFPASLLSNATPLPMFADLPPQAQDKKVLRTLAPPSPPPSHFGFPVLTALGHKAEALLPKRSVAIAPGALTFSAMGGKGQLNPAKRDDQSVEVTAAAPVIEKAEAGELDQSRAFSERALAAPASAYKMEKAARPQLAWKVADGKLLKSADSNAWTKGFAASEGIEFSVVRAYGANVWAGGANAALVHSRDGGATWERLTLGASATGTITSIGASGLNVHVRSSSGQSWSSQDGGKTWLPEN